MANLPLIQAAVAFVGILVLYTLRRRRNASALPLPPGPKGYPIIGNYLDLPPAGSREYEHWIKFKNTYGTLSSLTVFGQPMVIIHDRDAIVDIMEKMSLKSSSRPSQPFGNDMCGFGRLLPTLHYGPGFKQQRKMIHRQVGTKAVAAGFGNVQDEESKRLLLRLLDDPKGMREHIKTEAGAIILRIAYGYNVEPHKPEPLVQLVERMMECLGSVFVPLSWAVDVVPALRHLPEGFPGVKFQTVARRCKEVTDTVTDAPYNFVKQRMAEGTHTPSFVSSLVEQCGGGPDGRTPLDQGEEDAIKLAAAILYAGGADTTVSIISCMVMAMVLYPEVQQRAQKELDEVLGEQRLPRLEDRERLPYVSAVVKESQRWHPVVPIGTAHATDEEIVYKGYRIPKGTYLVPQIWWFLHDPDVHRDPERFDPERFLPPRNEPDPNASFGYGRRVCPGRFVADDSLFMTISRILAVFHAGKQRGDEGREVECRVDLSGGLLSRPAPFAYDLRPRSEAHAELIRGLERECPWEKGDIDSLEPKVRELAAQPKFF